MVNFLGAMKSAIEVGSILGIMAIGVYITFRVMHFADLTVDGSFTMGACITVALILGDFNGPMAILNNPGVSLIVAMLGGALAGAVTGILHTKLEIEGILSSILTMISLYSINLRIMGKANESIMKSETVFTKTNTLLDSILANFMSAEQIKALHTRGYSVIILSILITLGIVAVLYWFFGTEIGCAIRATGSNENMARALGVNVDMTKILGLSISNALVALSGGLFAQSLRFADVKMGIGTIVIGLASIVIGAVFSERGSFAFKLIATSLGTIIYRMIIGTVLEFGSDIGFKPDDQQIITAIIVIIALSIPKVVLRIKSIFAKKQEVK